MAAQDAVILGATGPTGSHLSAALNRRSIRDRAAMRNLKALDDSFVVTADEPAEQDALDPDALARTIDGYRLVYDCLTVPNEQIAKYPVMARNLAIAAAKTGAKVVHVSNYWSYLPLTYLPLDESHPREGGPDWAKYRREGEDVLLAGGAAVVQLPDFYGPHVHSGLAQRAIGDAYAGRAIQWVGPPDLEREYAYVADAMEAVVRLSYYPDVFGQRWIVGANGKLSAKALAEIVSKKLDRKVAVASAGPLALRARSFFDEKARAILPLVPIYTQPIRFNSAKLENVTGPIPASSHAQGIVRTIEWMERRRLVK